MSKVIILDKLQLKEEYSGIFYVSVRYVPNISMKFIVVRRCKAKEEKGKPRKRMESS